MNKRCYLLAASSAYVDCKELITAESIFCLKLWIEFFAFPTTANLFQFICWFIFQKLWNKTHGLEFYSDQDSFQDGLTVAAKAIQLKTEGVQVVE